MKSELLTVEETAECLRRRPQALREALCRSEATWAAWLRARRVRLGRRQYFRASDVLLVMEHGARVLEIRRLPTRSREEKC